MSRPETESIYFDTNIGAYSYRGEKRAPKYQPIQYRITILEYVKLFYSTDLDEEVFDKKNWSDSLNPNHIAWTMEDMRDVRGVKMCCCSHALTVPENFWFKQYKKAPPILTGCECIKKSAPDEIEEHKIIDEKLKERARERRKRKKQITSVKKTLESHLCSRKYKVKEYIKRQRLAHFGDIVELLDEHLRDRRQKIIMSITQHCINCSTLIQVNKYKIRCLSCWKKERNFDSDEGEHSNECSQATASWVKLKDDTWGVKPIHENVSTGSKLIVKNKLGVTKKVELVRNVEKGIWTYRFY